MNPKTSQDLFNKIRSQFSNIEIGDSTGQPTADPKGAVFFDFEFKEDADTFGRVSVSLADGESMKVFYNRNLVDKIDEDSRDEWYAFLKELKDFAVEHQLAFDVRDITKSNLTKQDYQNLADTNKTVNTDEMSEELNRITKLAGVEVKEGLTGTARRSYENLDKTRLIIRHSGKVDEEIPGSRSRHIDSLYIENEDGERFKYPVTHLAGARAMQRHVANGGRPHDDFGQHIIETSQDIAKLNSFSRYVAHKDQLNDNAGDIIEQTKLSLENLRSYVKNLSKQSHYEETVKSFKTAEDRVLDDETRNTYREKFTLKSLDDRVEEALPLIHRIMSEYKPDDKPKDIGEPIDAPVEPQVDHGAVVQSFLTDPDKKLVLRKDDSADKMLAVTKFNDKTTMLGSILSDIASRMLTKTPEEDRVANFASRVADGIEQEGTGSFKPAPDWNSNKKIAVQLARRYIDDYKKMQKDAGYGNEVRMDPEDYNPKKHPKLDKRARGETAEFEDWIDDTVNPKESQPDADSERADAAQGMWASSKEIQSKFKTWQDFMNSEDFDEYLDDKFRNQLEGLTFEDIKPYVSMYKGDDGKTVYDVLDKDSKSVYKTGDSKLAMNYLSKNFNKLRGDKVKESIKESRTKIVEAIKAKAEGNAQNIAGVEEEIERITQLANYH